MKPAVLFLIACVFISALMVTAGVTFAILRERGDAPPAAPKLSISSQRVHVDEVFSDPTTIGIDPHAEYRKVSGPPIEGYMPALMRATSRAAILRELHVDPAELARLNEDEQITRLYTAIIARRKRNEELRRIRPRR